MGGGKHKRLNPRGSQNGRKLAGDRLAEDVHGRKGMHKPQREKGPSRKILDSQREMVVQDLNKDEFQLLWLLHGKGRYCPWSYDWGELLDELKALGKDNAYVDADELLTSISQKRKGWLEYISYRSVCLRREHAQEIHQFVVDFLQTNEENE